MAVIHHTTMHPTKLELLSEWLPTRAWYTDGTDRPRPAKAGGFRLDDPAGEVGIEFMAVTEGTGPDAVAHLVPMTYRGAPLEGAEQALIGTSEHGVLGTRWIYDGTHDPVFAAQLYALLTGQVVAQHQSLDDTPDDAVTVTPAAPGTGAEVELVHVVDGPDHTDVVVREAGAPAPVTLRVCRVLRPGSDAGADPGLVATEWRLPDGSTVRGACTVLLADTDR
ncbi:1,4-alpha-glucan branching protein [Streptomyces sp. NPDC058877]|uniref:maltokinase N-terminal cap-like domain-containing protein n=1 Tax=unclassified Streptomyces TaxID=2593676 RepID=UPI0036913F33